MINNISENKIKDIISESLQEIVMRKQIEKIVTESLGNIIQNKLNEAPLPSKRDSLNKNHKKGKYSNKYKAVMNMLKDTVITDAQLAYQLWNEDEYGGRDGQRSLFSKMKSGKPESDGTIRRFKPEEINKLYELIRGIGK